MKKWMFIIIIIIITVNCKDKQNELKYLICRDTIQYWDYDWEKNEETGFHRFTFSFNVNGKLERYDHNIKKNKRFLNIESPNHSEDNIEKWTITKDSILTIMRSNDKITKISENQDTIYAFSISDKQKVKYVRVRGKLNIEKSLPKIKGIFIYNGDTIKNFKPFNL